MNSRGSFWANIPPVTKHLLIINFLLWLATIVLQRTAALDIQDWLGLHYWRASDFNAVQLVTYMFMHDSSGIAHVFFNMFSLWCRNSHGSSAGKAFLCLVLPISTT